MTSEQNTPEVVEQTYVCDIQDCGRQAQGAGKLPGGWCVITTMGERAQCCDLCKKKFFETGDDHAVLPNTR